MTRRVGIALAVVLFCCGQAVARPVRTVLEIRRDQVMIQKWDLSCGAAALGTLLQYEFGKSVTEREIATGLIKFGGYVSQPERVKIQQGFSLLDMKRYVEAQGFEGVGLGQLTIDDLIARAPVIIPINPLGYNHFVVFRGVMGNRVLLADPAWGNRTMTIDKFQRAWIEFGEPMGHVGFTVQRAGTRSNGLHVKSREFVMFN
jgi:predicted double-glycine peptidase